MDADLPTLKDAIQSLRGIKDATELFVFVATGEDEGVIALSVRSNPPIVLPLITSQRELAQRFAVFADAAAAMGGTSWRCLRFVPAANGSHDVTADFSSGCPCADRR